jgi:hypothetical protein
MGYMLNPFLQAAPLDLKTGLVAYYNFNEASGQRNDSHTNSYHLTDMNTVGSNTGVGGAGTAADFVAANSEWLSGPAVPLTAPFEICGWAYNNADPANERMFMEWAPGNPSPLGLTLSSSGRVGVRFLDADSNAQTLGGAAATDMTAATWYFIRLRHDGSAIFVSLNNGTETTLADNFHALTTEALTFGRFDIATDRFFDGRLQAWGVWSRNLTTAERDFLYNGGAAARLYADLPG